MKTIIRVIKGSCFVALVVHAMSAHAEPNLSARHETVGTSYGDGIYTIQLQIQVTNSGSEDLKSIVLTPQDPSLMVNGIAQSQNVGNLNPGQAIQLNWTLNSLMPVEYFQGLPLLLEGEAQTATGDATRLNVESIGG